jgi:plastocyanin
MRRAALLAVLCGILSGCSVWGPEGGPGGSGIAGATPSVASVDAVAGPDGVQRVEISAGDDLQFTPAVVRARTGVIEFTIRNTGQTPHDVRFEAPAPAGTGNVNGGQTTVIRVTVDRPGTYPFPCLYHVSSGMKGQLEVT